MYPYRSSCGMIKKIYANDASICAYDVMATANWRQPVSAEQTAHSRLPGAPTEQYLLFSIAAGKALVGCNNSLPVEQKAYICKSERVVIESVLLLTRSLFSLFGLAAEKNFLVEGTFCGSLHPIWLLIFATCG